MGKKRYFNKKRKYEDVFLQNKFDGDIVFSRFINYMQIALYHKKLDYDKHQEFLMSQEEKLNYRGWSVLSDQESVGHPFFSMSKDYRELDIAISKLTDKQRYVIINHYYKKKSLSTIAKKLKMNSNAVYQLKVRALLSLKRFMEDWKIWKWRIE